MYIYIYAYISNTHIYIVGVIGVEKMVEASKPLSLYTPRGLFRPLSL